MTPGGPKLLYKRSLHLPVKKRLKPLGYWLFVVWSAALLTASLGVFLHKCRLPRRGLHLLIPLLPVGIGVVLLGMLLWQPPRIFGIQIWHIGEIYTFMAIGFLEGCIQTSLIPSNQHYRRVFSLLDIPARIETQQDEVIYATKGAEHAFVAGEDMQQSSVQLSGGRVAWLADLRNLHRLDRELEATVEQLESRNSTLQTEASVREEKEQNDTRNRLYSHIARAVAPELNAVEQLLTTHPEADPDTPSRIAVLNAYIKRRGNLELMAEEAAQISSRELMLAIHESLIYTELCGVEVYADCSLEYMAPSVLMIDAYTGFERLPEMLLDDLLAMAVYVFADQNEVRLRFYCRV